MARTKTAAITYSPDSPVCSGRPRAKNIGKDSGIGNFGLFYAGTHWILVQDIIYSRKELRLYIRNRSKKKLAKPVKG